MLNASKLIESFNQIVGWPYKSPGTNNQNGIDCSGAFVRAYKMQNASIYHGSNRIMRVYCQKQMKITSWDSLRLAMPMFKARSDLSNLSSQYKPGGKYYNPALPDDYYHIGLITSLEPLTITNATTPVARADSFPRKSGESDAAYHTRAVSAINAKGWTWCAQLSDVPYEGGGGTEPEPGTDTKTVVVSASSVNMRKTPAGTYMLRIPGGTTLTITDETTKNGILYGQTTYNRYTGWVDETYVTVVEGNVGGGRVREQTLIEDSNEEEAVFKDAVTVELTKDMAYTLYDALSTALNEGMQNG